MLAVSIKNLSHKINNTPILNDVILIVYYKSDHSVFVKDNNQVSIFTDFIQSVLEKKQKIKDVIIMEKT